MHPVLLEIKGFKIYTYGPLMAIAFLAAFFLMYHLAKKKGEDVEFYMDLYIWLIVFGLLGAKLLYNFIEYEEFFAHPIKMMNCRNGGLVWYGGVILDAAFVIWYARWRGMAVLSVMDTLAAPLSLGLAIGRWGCLMGGCCYGKAAAVPWAIVYPEGANPVAGTLVHPTPIYESLASLIIAAVIYLAVRRNMRTGGPILLWLILYPLARFFIEFFRGDEIRGFVYKSADFSLSTSQLISILIFVVAVGLAVRLFLKPAVALPGADSVEEKARAGGDRAGKEKKEGSDNEGKKKKGKKNKS